MKKNRIFKKFSAVARAAVLLATAGCSGYLSVKPQGEVIPETDDEFASIIHYRLRQIEGGEDEYVVGNIEAIVHFDGVADDLDANIRNNANLPSFAGDEINSRQLAYENAWEVVKDCNIVIENLEGRDTDVARGALAAAYSMKAIVYCNLLREYCQPWSDSQADGLPGIPIVDKFDISATPTRGTMRQTYDYARSLFSSALALDPQDPTYVFTEWIIKGFQARLEFWCGQWDNVISLCEDILSGSGYTLTPISEYADMINAEYDTKGEVMVRSYINNSCDMAWYINYLKSYIGARPACARLIKLFGDEPEKDVRYSCSFDKKRMNVKNPVCRLRLSEIVLMLSEAYYHKGDDASALKLLNELRRNRIKGVADLTTDSLPEVRTGDRITVDCYGQPLTPLLQAIFDERRKELYLERDRWFELKRNGRPEWWIISNGLKYTTKEYLYTSPISKSDVDRNPELVQNPGYVY